MCINKNAFTHIELYFKFVFQELVNVPTLAKPPRTLRIGFQTKPVVISIFVVLHILNIIVKMRVHVIVDGKLTNTIAVDAKLKSFCSV